jgi:6-phosphogluconolactonase (cycloisomerase 2 family)
MEFLHTLSPEFRVSNARPGRRSGALTPVANTILNTLPDGSINLDMTSSEDGRYLYTLNSGSGTISVYSINSSGSLTELGDIEGLPQTAGFNGIAAL